MYKKIALAFAAATPLLAACGGSSSETSDKASITVATSPKAVTMQAGTSMPLVAQAAVNNLQPGAGTAVYVSVDWALQEADGGTLASPTSDGEIFKVTYTAPTKSGVYHVVARDHDDSSVAAVVTVTVD
jgi:hypothetical protein